MANTGREAVQQLTDDKIREIAAMLKSKRFVTEHCKGIDGYSLLSRRMIEDGLDLLTKRLKDEANCTFTLLPAFEDFPEPVYAIFDSDCFNCTSEFKTTAFRPFIKELINNKHFDL
ncbi:hypothetical protein [Bacillus sp. RC145]|uniref:hypothetical protein n=1 Tax=Bacillus sp. RC145 TaxID=3156280 RepID=UPI0038514AB3